MLAGKIKKQDARLQKSPCVDGRIFNQLRRANRLGEFPSAAGAGGKREPKKSKKERKKN